MGHTTRHNRQSSRLFAIHQDEDGNCIFGQKSHWDAMYDGNNKREINEPADSYSWYCGWDELAPFWNMMVPQPNKARILIAGIGNDPCPVQMYDAGYNHDMIAYDYSQAGVDRAAQLFGNTRNNVRLFTADARDLHFLETSSIDATLDKGTFDAISITGMDVFLDAVKEAGRVTATNGVFFCISRVLWPDELLRAFDTDLWEIVHDGSLAFAPDGEATIDLGADLYSWRRTGVPFLNKSDSTS